MYCYAIYLCFQAETVDTHQEMNEVLISILRHICEQKQQDHAHISDSNKNLSPKNAEVGKRRRRRNCFLSVDRLKLSLGIVYSGFKNMEFPYKSSSPCSALLDITHGFQNRLAPKSATFLMMFYSAYPPK